MKLFETLSHVVAHDKMHKLEDQIKSGNLSFDNYTSEDSNNNNNNIQTQKPKIENFALTDSSARDIFAQDKSIKDANNIIKYGLSLGALYTANEALKKQKVQAFVRNYINMKYMDESVRTSGMQSLKIFGGDFNMVNIGMEISRRLEELSPFSILRTFQMSHFLQPFASKNADVDISGEIIQKQRAYFEEMFERHGKRGLTELDAKLGLKVSKGKVLDASGDVVLDSARVVATEWTGDAAHSNRAFVNRVLRRHIATTEGYSKKAVSQMFNFGEQEGLSRLTLIAGETDHSLMTNWVKSAASLSAAQGFNMVNEPLGFIEELGGVAFGDAKGKWYQRLGKLKINPNANIDSSLMDLTRGYLKHGAMKAGLALGAFYAIDNASKLIGPSGTGFDKGIKEGLATSFVKAKLGYASVVGDNLSEYRQEQEYVAPKSTSILNLAGLPLAGVMFGGTIAYGQRLAETATTEGGYEAALRSSQAIKPIFSTQLQKDLFDIGVSDSLTVGSRGRRYALMGAAVGALFALPFLPGAIVGESSDEIRAEYFGDKEVATRSNQYWFCLHPDTQLLTNNGNKRADEVSIGDKLMDRYGSYNRVIDISIRPAAEKVYDIRTINTQCIPMKLTGEHEVLTPNGWKMAKQLSPGDKVLAPIPEFDDSNTRLHPIEYLSKDVFTVHNGFVKKNQLQKNGKKSPTATGMIPEQIDLNFNFGKLLGWFVAEGTLPSHLDNGVMEIAFHNSEVGFALEISEYIKSITGKLPRLYRNQGNGKRIRFSSYCLFNLLKSMIYRDGMKIVPDMTSFPKEVIRGFIVGMFYGDGTISKSNGVRSRWSIKSQHMQNLLELRRYLSIFHVYGSISMDSGSFKLDLGSKWSKMAHENIGIYKELYSYENGFFDRYSSNSSSVDFKDGLLEIEISSIDSFYYEGVVYDYTMENIHEYSATTFIVHNSGSNEYEGGGIKYFARNWYQRLMADSKDKVLYGDIGTEEDMNPFLSPFDYLRNPYQLEEAHKEDMPYPVWGMDVSFGGWAGKIFEKTVGQVIKPDIINPELEKMQDGGQATGITDYNAVGLSSDGSSGILADGIGLSVSAPEISIPVNETTNAISLMKDGMMTRAQSPSYDPNSEALQYTFNAGLDFIGLKGWALGMAAEGVGVGNNDYSNQLARSGESTNIARDLQSHNFGGLFGGADVLRRIIPMSSGVMYDRNNPLQNSVAPSWLPNDLSSYSTDFSKGNYWQTVERGEERLPGVGYEQYYPHLAGIDPEDYSDIDKYRVLSDVAYGSKEYFDMSSYMSGKYKTGGMTPEEQTEYGEIFTQTQMRGQKKNFYEYKTDEEMDGVSLLGQALGGLWEQTTHNAELPTEYLSFFRPAGKLLHQRTAIEDYRKTQILGTDQSMWDRPYDHFIKPFFNEMTALTDNSFVPEETQEKRNTEQYFDSLEYYKQMKVYKENAGVNDEVASAARRAASKTIHGAIASGLDDRGDIARAYSALSSEEKAYFTSFTNAEKDDREVISSMEDSRTSTMYNMLWRRKDVVENGGDIHSYVQSEEEQLQKNNQSAYRSYLGSEDKSKGITFREYLQEEEAKNVINNATGMPDDSFVGWDPRINIRDVKLRTLMVGEEDIKKYGFWDSDEENLSRQSAVLADDSITRSQRQIKTTMAQQRFNYSVSARDTLSKHNIDVKNISFSNVGFGDFNLDINN